MAIVGGAVLTPLMGWISQVTHRISLAYAVPLICYGVIAIYSFLWQKMQTAETAILR
jgi:FHS family L-fucose permease-like MFS transporter